MTTIPLQTPLLIAIHLTSNEVEINAQACGTMVPTTTQFAIQWSDTYAGMYVPISRFTMRLLRIPTFLLCRAKWVCPGQAASYAIRRMRAR